MATRRRVSENEELNAIEDTPVHHSKRIRLNPNSEDDNTSNDEEEEGVPFPVGDDGYVEGSIVKITLRNFVTYNYCEVNPGPQLNMIIGPNGTGKSTIVCAVALGLGGSPSLLGRAKNIAEFVQTGEDEAMIQIELKKANGKTTTQKEVLSVIARLNIQVDNLWYLSKMCTMGQLSPPQLLERTQEAAGEKELSDWQNQLITWRTEQKSLSTSHESDQTHLKTLISRNETLEKDVQKMKEREAILKTIAILQAKLPLAKYSDAKKQHNEAKEEERQKLAAVRELEIVTEPILSIVRECENAAESSMRNKTVLVESTRKKEENLKKITDEIESSKNASTTAKAEIDSLEKRETQRKNEISAMEAKIIKFESVLGEEPPVEDTDEIQTALESIRSKTNAVDEKIHSLNYESENVRRQQKVINRSMSAKEDELREVNNVFKMRLSGMRKFNEDTVKAFQWLQENRGMFKGKIYGPVAMLLNLKDARYADIVESALGGEKGANLRQFICENQEDYTLFSRETVDKKGWRLTVGWPGEINRSEIQTPMTDEELKRQYGLDHFLVNLLVGPQIVIDYLCVQAKIHLVPVALRIANETKLAEDATFMRYIMQDNVYETKKYSYGRGGSQTTVRKIRRAALLTDTGMFHCCSAGLFTYMFIFNLASNEARSKIASNINELKGQLSGFDEHLATLTGKMNQLRQEKEELNHQKEDLQSQRRDKLQQRVAWEKRARGLDNLREDLVRKKERPSEARDEIRQFKEKLITEITRRGKLAVKLTNLTTQYVESVLKRNVASMDALQTSGKLDCVKGYSRIQMEKLGIARNEHKEASRLAEEKKKEALKYYEAAQRAGETIMEELADEFAEIFEKWSRDDHIETQIELEDAINGAQAKANALKSNSPGALEQYQKRVIEIKRLTQKIEEDTVKMQTLSKKMDDIKGKWEPRLVRVVSRISDKFSEALQRIGCAGEVCVSRHEDFDKWGIEIRVKFRDHEKLQLLTGQRQSGGERAVSTILYLMSLQDLARTPFRVVDEINQGMDPRNERMIHEQIVRGASKQNTAQYFLITPKLLPDLYYNEHMRVLCIYNGEWQPERMKMVSDYLRNARTAAVA
ncbi:Structural maintenance of chromosomes protein 5 [Apophysomyces sp. BC1034]|nr:Structural maintenance of chromosomes protein 5 [Apophysomyces sp. BC1034]